MLPGPRPPGSEGEAVILSSPLSDVEMGEGRGSLQVELTELLVWKPPIRLPHRAVLTGSWKERQIVSSKGVPWLSKWEKMYYRKFKDTLLVFWKGREMNRALVPWLVISSLPWHVAGQRSCQVRDRARQPVLAGNRPGGRC